MNELTGEEILALKPGTTVFAVKRRGVSAPSPNLRKIVVYEVGVEDNEYFIKSNRGVWGTWDSNHRHFFLNYWDAYKAVRKIWGHEK